MLQNYIFIINITKEKPYFKVGKTLFNFKFH